MAGVSCAVALRARKLRARDERELPGRAQSIWEEAFFGESKFGWYLRHLELESPFHAISASKQEYNGCRPSVGAMLMESMLCLNFDMDTAAKNATKGFDQWMAGMPLERCLRRSNGPIEWFGSMSKRAVFDSCV